LHANTCNKTYKKKWEREREEWERFGQHKLALRIDCKRGGVGIILYLGEKRDPSLMSSKWHQSRERGQSQGGRTFRVLVEVRV
jgi:hypothetical protein